MNRILDAAEELIGEKGEPAVSIGEIARRAKSSVGGFYARFRDKDELLVALHERRLIEVRKQVAETLEPTQWAEKSLSEVVRACVRSLITHSHQRPRLNAAFVAAVVADPDRWAPAVAFRSQMIDGFSRLVLTRRAEIHHPEPELGVRFAVESLANIHDQRMLFAEIHNSLDQETLIEELSRFFIRYLSIQD